MSHQQLNSNAFIPNYNHLGTYKPSAYEYNYSNSQIMRGRKVSIVSIEDEYTFSQGEKNLKLKPLDEQFSLANKLNVPKGFTDETLLLQQSISVVGHRGALYQEPENTMASFEACVAMGCDAVELDVFLMKCGSVIVFHGHGSDQDPGYLNGYMRFKKTENHMNNLSAADDGNEGEESRINILDFSSYNELNEWMEFDPNGELFACNSSRFLSNRANKIPKLEDVLTMAKKTDLILKIELKGPGTAEPVLKLVEDMDMVDQCHFSSFSHDRIKRVRELRPDACTGALFSVPPSNFVSIALSVGASEVHLKYDSCTLDNIREIHKAGMNSMAWFPGSKGMFVDVTEKYLDVGNEDFDMYRTLISTGVRSLCCNKPDVLLKLLGRHHDELLPRSVSSGSFI